MAWPFKKKPSDDLPLAINGRILLRPPRRMTDVDRALMEFWPQQETTLLDIENPDLKPILLHVTSKLVTDRALLTRLVDTDPRNFAAQAQALAEVQAGVRSLDILSGQPGAGTVSLVDQQKATAELQTTAFDQRSSVGQAMERVENIERAEDAGTEAVAKALAAE